MIFYGCALSFFAQETPKNSEKISLYLLAGEKNPAFIFSNPAVYFKALKMCSQIRLISACISPS